MTIYKCEVCGNVVELIFNGGGRLVCCGQDMVKLIPNQEETTLEKHVPYIIEKDNMIEVQIGETTHPMEENHHIEWIALATDKGVVRKKLKPGEEPRVTFEKTEKYVVVTYCNVHGLYVK